MKVIKLSQLRVGQRFSFIPSHWYGPCRLTVKDKRTETVIDNKALGWKFKTLVKYDIKYDANVVNPPGVIYGLSGDLKVRLLSQKKRKSMKGHRAAYFV